MSTKPKLRKPIDRKKIITASYSKHETHTHHVKIDISIENQIFRNWNCAKKADIEESVEKIIIYHTKDG